MIIGMNPGRQADDALQAGSLLMLEHFHLVMTVMGVLTSVLVWRWSARRYRGFIADESRLFLLAVLTAGLPTPAGWGYMLFWVMAVANPLSLWPAFILLMLFWWIGCSIIFHWARWTLREIRG